MHIVQVLSGQIRQYKRSAILTPVFTLLEVLMEILIPFVTASLIDQGIQAGNMEQILHYGLIMLMCLLRMLRPALRRIFVIPCTQISRHFLSPILISIRRRDLSPG